MEMIFIIRKTFKNKNNLGLQAELLMKVHHKNLVPFVGYCDENNKMALIYEYMENGNLKDYLSGRHFYCSKFYLIYLVYPLCHHLIFDEREHIVM